MSASHVSTHVMVPESLAEGLRALCLRTRVRQSDYLVEAVTDVLATYGEGKPPPPGVTQDGTPLVSLVFRLPRTSLVALHALAARSRVRQSEWVRLAVEAVLRKHGMKAVAA